MLAFIDILGPMKDLIKWTIELLHGMATDILEYIFPGFDPVALGSIADGLGLANQYVPLDLLFLYLTTYFGFVLGYATMKISIKLIPFGVG